MTEGFNFGIWNGECRTGGRGVRHRLMEDRRNNRAAGFSIADFGLIRHYAQKERN